MTEATWAALIVVCGLVVLAAVGAFAYTRTTHGRRPLYAKQVVVQLLDGSAVSGVMTRSVPGFYVIENARHHQAGASVAVDGAAWLPNERVSWVQVGNWQDGGEQ